LKRFRNCARTKCIEGQYLIENCARKNVH